LPSRLQIGLSGGPGKAARRAWESHPRKIDNRNDAKIDFIKKILKLFWKCFLKTDEESQHILLFLAPHTSPKLVNLGNKSD
jgi:hypothetical protein